MNNLRNILTTAVLFVVMIVSSSNAQVKFDVSRGANKVTETVSGWSEQGQKIIEESTTLQTMAAYGKGAMEAAKMMQETVADAKNMVNDVKSSVNSVKDTAMSTVSDITSEAKGLQGDVTGAAGGVVGSAAGGVSGAVSAAASKSQSAQELAKLKKEKSAIESEYKAAAAARKTEFEGQLKSYEENNTAYQKMIAEDSSQKEELEAKIASNNQAMTSLREQYEAKEAEEKSASNARAAEIDNQIRQLQDQVLTDGLSLANEDVKSMAKSLFGGGQSAAEMNKMIANNFIPADEPLTAKTIKKVRNYRNQTAITDTLQSMATMMMIKAGRDKDNGKTEEIADKVPAMDGSSAAVALDTQIKVENMKAILVYTKLLLADLKMRTAMDLSKLNVYQLRNPNKDVTQFNLDDYKYKKPSKANKKTIVDLAKKVAKEGSSVVNDVKSSGITGMNDVTGMLSLGGKGL